MVEETVAVQKVEYLDLGTVDGRTRLDAMLAAGWRYVASIPNPNEPGKTLLILEGQMTIAERQRRLKQLGADGPRVRQSMR